MCAGRSRRSAPSRRCCAESGDGVIVNISSGAAQSGTGSSIIYGASKAALNTMSMALARVLGPEIRVVVVAPGMVHTGFVPGRTEEMMAKAAMATPLKRAIEAGGRGPGGDLLRHPSDAYHRFDHRGRCRAAPLRG